ncbi:MAG: VPLPA-CTERM sorting domain-containing protein [Gammaproteobacteria bacterium]|nr:VPLPA-CTERM sorting domain-containing protein [Gammaproteobacteria bacterium]
MKYIMCVLPLATAGIISLEATAAPIDLNDFFTLDPEVVIAPDGMSANFSESAFSTFVTLINDPGLGDLNVIVPNTSTFLTFNYEFTAAVGDQDEFSAYLFDSDNGPIFGLLETFRVSSSSSGVASFDLEPWQGLVLGLQFELIDLSLGSIDSTATVSNLALTQVVPIPPAVWLFGSGLIGLIGIARRKKS